MAFSHYDLAIVGAVLAAQASSGRKSLDARSCWVNWDWTVTPHPVRGILPATLAAQQAGFTRVILPLRQSGEAKLVEGIDVFGSASITHGRLFCAAPQSR
jgi:magnesium chelatase family protein